jgi:hypothetical protein
VRFIGSDNAKLSLVIAVIGGSEACNLFAPIPVTQGKFSASARTSRSDRCPMVRLSGFSAGARTQPATSALVECLAVVDPLARLIPRPSSWCSPVALDLPALARCHWPAPLFGGMALRPAPSRPRRRAGRFWGCWDHSPGRSPVDSPLFWGKISSTKSRTYVTFSGLSPIPQRFGKQGGR